MQDTTIIDIKSALQEKGWICEYESDWRVTMSFNRQPTSMIRFECVTVKIMHMSHDNTFEISAKRERTVSRIGIWSSETRNFSQSFVNGDKDATVAAILSYCEELL